MIGMVFDGLWPPKPWQALEASARVAPGASSGPAATAGASRSRSRRLTRVGIAFSLFIAAPRPAGPQPRDGLRRAPRIAALTKDVLPDAGGPADRVLRPRLR